jgi:heme-degrading monooxygenase HmoA
MGVTGMVRVLIERRLSPGGAESFAKIMREMRRDAVHAPGYISGETLRDVADPHHSVVVSTWRSREDWDAWAVSAPRARARQAIAPLLAEPERVTVLEPV